jgi:DNA-binding NarL/FixJ family response regulator
MKLLIEQSPDILIVGADLEGVNGLDLVGYILEKKLHTKSILFSRDKSPALLIKAKQLRVAGLLFADDGRPELSRCLEMVMAGNSYVSPGVEKRLLERAGRVLSGSGLTTAELKILWISFTAFVG